MQHVFTIVVALLAVEIQTDPGDFRPPAVPLIVFSPHVSVWSFTDNLTDSDTVHWSGSPLGFHGLIEIDNTDTYRFLGTLPNNTQALVQKKVVVQPWRTIYTFSTPTNTLELLLIFSQPTSIDDPYTYITFNVRTLDEKNHTVRIYFDFDSSLSINSTKEKVYWSRSDVNATVLTMNGYIQIPFDMSGDRVRNNWGYAHLISGNESITTGHQACGDDLRRSFSNHQPMPNDDTRKPRRANDEIPTSAFVINIGEVSMKRVSSYVIFLYDDVYSVFYFGDWEIPYWRAKFHNNVTLLINESIVFYESKMDEITNVNAMMIKLLINAGGDEYEKVCSLVSRQVTGAISRTWSYQYNRSQVFMKEISSCGAINTVDVAFPSSPFFLWLYPEILRDLVVPILAYANNDTNDPYNLTWAPHGLGIWPICNVLSIEQEQMPMEESSNMLLMIAGIVQRTKKSDFLQPYWNLLEIWAQYLNNSLPDPGNQLCTDDFEGPSPHNCNLAVKGILGLGAYSILLNITGQSERASAYMNDAKDYVNYWLKAAHNDNHYRLQYDLPNSWSQKYNLIYQKILSLDLFPVQVDQVESDYYQSQLFQYGVPLDCRSNVTKSDWSSWSAALGTNEQSTSIFNKLYKFANETLNRMPLTDLYNVVDGRVSAFRARPVLGGLFILALIANPPINV